LARARICLTNTSPKPDEVPVTNQVKEFGVIGQGTYSTSQGIFSTVATLYISPWMASAFASVHPPNVHAA
jgi:hypothetical protein